MVKSLAPPCAIHLDSLWGKGPVDSQVQWPGVPARLMVLQSSSLISPLAGSHSGCQLSLEKKGFKRKEKRKNNEFALLESLCPWSWHLALWGVNHPHFLYRKVSFKWREVRVVRERKSSRQGEFGGCSPWKCILL